MSGASRRGPRRTRKKTLSAKEGLHLGPRIAGALRLLRCMCRASSPRRWPPCRRSMIGCLAPVKPFMKPPPTKTRLCLYCWWNGCCCLLLVVPFRCSPPPPPHFCADEMKDDFDTLGPDAALQAVGNGTGEFSSSFFAAFDFYKVPTSTRKREGKGRMSSLHHLSP